MTPLGDNGNKTRSRLFQVVILKQQKVSTVVRCSLNLASDGYEMTFDALSLFATEPLWSWLAFLQYYCLNALFWPIFDGIVNHKHHDFDVNKSERDDYGHYWTISESDLDLKTSAAREWASRACLLVGGPLLTLWPTFELREKYSKSSLIWTRIKPTLEISTWLIWSFALARFLRSFKDLNCFSIVSVCLRGGQSQQIYFYSNKHFLVSDFSVSRHF